MSQLQTKILKRIHDVLLDLEDDQQRIDLLRSLDEELDQHVSYSKEDITIPTSIGRSRGRPKSTTDKRLPSSFEIKEKEDAKKAALAKKGDANSDASLPDAQQKGGDDDTYDDRKGSTDIGEEVSCLSSAFILYQVSKRKDPDIGYLQKAKR